MSQRAGNRPVFESGPTGFPVHGPSEVASASEHQAALEATVFRGESESSELVLELEAGELRLRPRRP